MHMSSKTQVVTPKGETKYFPVFPKSGGITSRISPESSLVHFNNGRYYGKHTDGSTLGDYVRGRRGDVCYGS